MKKLLRTVTLLLLPLVLSSCSVKPYNTRSGYDLLGAWYSDQFETDSLSLFEDLSYSSTFLGTGTFAVENETVVFTAQDGTARSLVLEPAGEGEVRLTLDGAIPVSWFRTRLEAVLSKQQKTDLYGSLAPDIQEPRSDGEDGQDDESPFTDGDRSGDWDAYRKIREVLMNSSWSDTRNTATLEITETTMVFTRKAFNRQEQVRYTYSLDNAETRSDGFAFTLQLTDMDTGEDFRINDIRIEVKGNRIYLSSPSLPYSQTYNKK